MNVTLSKWFVEKRGRAIGIAAIGLSIGGVILPPTITPIIDAHGWRTGWVVLAVMSWVLIYPSAIFMRRQPEDLGLFPDGKSEEEIRAGAGRRAQQDFAESFTRSEALRTSQLYVIAFAFAISGAAIITVLTQGFAYMTDSGFSKGTAAFMLSTYAITSGTTKPGWGYLIERIHPRYLAATSFVIAFVALFGVLASVRAGSTETLTASFLLLGAGVGGQLPIQETIWGTYFGRRYLGEVRSVALPMALVVSAGAPLATAYYFDVSGAYEAPFAILGVAWLVGAWMILLARPPKLPARILAALGTDEVGAASAAAGQSAGADSEPAGTT